MTPLWAIPLAAPPEGCLPIPTHSAADHPVSWRSLQHWPLHRGGGLRRAVAGYRAVSLARLPIRGLRITRESQERRARAMSTSDDSHVGVRTFAQRQPKSLQSLHDTATNATPSLKRVMSRLCARTLLPRPPHNGSQSIHGWQAVLEMRCPTARLQGPGAGSIVNTWTPQKTLRASDTKAVVEAGIRSRL